MLQVTGQQEELDYVCGDSGDGFLSRAGHVPNASIDVSTRDRYKTSSFDIRDADNEFSHVG
jgi:hypothetical protein